MSPMRLELVNLRKRFGDTEVLDDISLTVQQGEFVSILGPSGAGKSTILQLLIGATAPDAGEMLMDGQPIAPTRHRFAFMPQGDALMPWRRILDNATLGLEVQGLSRKAARARASTARRSRRSACDWLAGPDGSPASGSAAPCDESLAVGPVRAADPPWSPGFPRDGASATTWKMACTPSPSRRTSRAPASFRACRRRGSSPGGGSSTRSSSQEVPPADPPGKRPGGWPASGG